MLFDACSFDGIDFPKHLYIFGLPGSLIKLPARGNLTPR